MQTKSERNYYLILSAILFIIEFLIARFCAICPLAEGLRRRYANYSVNLLFSQNFCESSPEADAVPDVLCRVYL